MNREARVVGGSLFGHFLDGFWLSYGSGRRVTEASKGALWRGGRPSGKKGVWLRIRSVFCMAALLAVAPIAEAAKIRIFVDTPAGVQQKVYLTRSTGLASNRPIVFVLHGEDRDAIRTRDEWHELAIRYKFLLVVPKFSDRRFPGSAGYEQGNVFDVDGKVLPAAAWSFSAIEPIFEEVRRRYNMTTRGYSIYGRGAGGRFLHRFLYHLPQARVKQAVVADAVWYTLPAFNTEFPYGLRNSAASSTGLAAALQLPVTLLLGEADTNPNYPVLNPTVGMLAQGPHCLARGQTFFDTAADSASRLGVPFGWQLVTVPQADHDDQLLPPAIISLLLQDTEMQQYRLEGNPDIERMPERLPQTGP